MEPIIFLIIGFFVLFFIGIFLFIIFGPKYENGQSDFQNSELGNTGTTPIPNEPNPDRSVVLMSRAVG